MRCALFDGRVPPMKITILALFLSISAHASTYTESAPQAIQAKLETFQNSLKAFDENSLPHEAKALRKELVALRDQLDLFVFAYSAKENDIWKETRNFLDVGYEAMGEFKDLYDSQFLEEGEEPDYDKKEVKSLRNPILQWKSKFEKQNWEFFLEVDGKIFDRKSKDLSRFYWGSVEVRPKKNDSVSEAFSKLTIAVIHEAKIDLKKVVKLENPSENLENAEEFHDFRKRVRTVSKVFSYYPALTSRCESEDVENLDLLQSRYGDVNDKVYLSLKLEKKGKNKAAKKIKEEIETLWKELLEFQEDLKIKDILESLKSCVNP
jgi:hypothetical protein